MPSSASGQYNYYTSHHRRPSQAAHTNVASPRQLESGQTEPQALPFLLPATTYSNPVNKTSRNLSSSTGVSGQSQFGGIHNEASPDPHDFYRQHQEQYSHHGAGLLSQNSLVVQDIDQHRPGEGDTSISEDSSSAFENGVKSPRTRSRRPSKSTNAQQFSASALYEASKSTPTLSGQLRSRKSSFKDLVAKFDSSNDPDIPPVPSKPPSRAASRTVSPTAEFRRYHISRSSQSAGTGSMAADLGGSLSYANAFTRSASQQSKSTVHSKQNSGNLNISVPQRRPLFGEITPALAGSLRVGYGINNPRRRSGSVGSPMHSPNPMFPRKSPPESSALSPESPTTWYKTAMQPSNAHLDKATSAIPRPTVHRRANSDFAPNWDNPPQQAVTGPSAYYVNSTPNTDAVTSNSKRTSQSRIPISNRRHSINSDSGHSTPSSRAASMLGKHPTARSGTTSTSNATLKTSSKQASPKVTPRTPIKIKSPGSRAQAITVSQSEKSPSLRANIIVPPPKISPPLRSSRPRLPVSSATTSASRAKMAEKFSSMHKQNQDKRVPARKLQRPPELNDIDLQARRLKITQALTRSLQGVELRGELEAQRRESDNANGSDARSESYPITSTISEVGVSSPRQVPAVVISQSAPSENFHGGFDSIPAARDSSPMMPGSFPEESPMAMAAPVSLDDESPTLGRSALLRRETLPLRTHLDEIETEAEPCSAVTADTMETEGTIFEAEPQTEFTRPVLPGHTILNQVMQMRNPSHSSTSSRSSEANNPNHDADQESIHIMLRNTTYIRDSDAFEHVQLSSGAQDQSHEDFEARDNDRNSWTSSISGKDSDEERGIAYAPAPVLGNEQHMDYAGGESHARLQRHQDYWKDVAPETLRSTMASDAYTIVNFVLQQHSMSGIVNDEVADQIYNRILSQSPKLTDEGTLDSEKIEQLCQEAIQDFELRQDPQDTDSSVEHTDLTTRDAGRAKDRDSPELLQPEVPADAYGNAIVSVGPSTWSNKPSQIYHRPKASLDSAEDWADTSPSVGSWIHFTISPTEKSRAMLASQLRESSEAKPMTNAVSESREPFPQAIDLHGATNTDAYLTKSQSESALPRPPSNSPPLPPLPHVPFAPQTLLNGLLHEGGTGVTANSYPKIQPPQVPRRVTSSSQMMTQSSYDSAPVTPSGDYVSDGRPSLERPSMDTTSTGSSPTPEQRRLKQRRHVLKELVDTEARFEKDMKVLSDIYRETAYPSLSQEDIKILFGNADQILHFVVEFLGSLKQGAKPAYVIDRSDKYQNLRSRTDQDRRESQASDQWFGLSDTDKDKQTRIGEMFEQSLTSMGAVYSEYIRNHDAANKKLQSVQRNFGVQQWLNECKANSTDLTTAWDLDSLLVKPVQRIMKYPLLIGQLIEATPEDHPDLSSLRSALLRLTDLNTRINEAKKQVELVEQALNRKRKESDVRNGLTKALGRRTEKLRQHVGISEMFEDREYNSLKTDFLENSSHLVIVRQDIQGYENDITQWVTRMCELAAAGDAWADVSQTTHTTAESKLRQFAILVRRISTIALPDHLNKVRKTVGEPMEKAFKLLENLANDPKGLLQKRDKRLIDYARFKNMKDRGEKLDKKTIEKIEQWEALNTEAKLRIRKLLLLTAQLVQAAQDNYVKLHLAWLDMCNRKFSAAMAIDLDKLKDANIEKEWQEDFDYQQASALSLSICNGSLLAEAVNMVNLLTPASTLNGDESPRQPSWNSSNKRTISLNSDSSHTLPMEFNKRHSGSYVSSPMAGNASEGAPSMYANGRLRAASTVSGPGPRTPEAPFRGTSLSAHTSGSLISGRPGTSPAPRSTEPTPSLPRLSVDAPSPSIGPLRVDTPPSRPDSASTFFSVNDPTNHVLPYQAGAGPSTIFSSAMPMSESQMNMDGSALGDPDRPYDVLFTAASVYEFNIDRSRREAGFPYLTYVAGEIFDVIGERGELWLARNQDDPQRQIGWIWNKHFAKLAE